jgi:hypothetical protein
MRQHAKNQYTNDFQDDDYAPSDRSAKWVWASLAGFAALVLVVWFASNDAPTTVSSLTDQSSPEQTGSTTAPAVPAVGGEQPAPAGQTAQ